MGDTDFNKLFINNDTDPLDDPVWQAAATVREKPKRERTAGAFYHCPEAWANAAILAAGQYPLLVLRLYRHWRKREPGTDVVAVTAHALKGPGYSHRGRRRVVSRLAEAGLVKVMEQKNRQAPKLRVIELK